MSATIVNPMKKLRAYLLNKTAAEDRVFSGGLPPTDLLVKDTRYIDQLKETIVLMAAPGSKDPDLPVLLPRFLVRSYAPTEMKADDLAYDVLGELDNVTIDDNGFRLCLWLNGGPNSDRDQAGFIFTDFFFSGISK